MERIQDGRIRSSWEQIIKDQGLTYYPTTLPDGTIRSYWREGPYYRFSNSEIEAMHEQSKTLFDMFIDAGDYIVAHPEVMDQMRIPLWARDQIKASWDRFDSTGEPVDWGSVYGRIDVRYGGNTLLDTTSEDNKDGADDTLALLRLYEFNADTPTSLLESAIVQWDWHKQTEQGDDQWNGIYEMLVDAWTRNLKLIEEELGHKPTIYFACSWEDNLLPELQEMHSDFGITDLELDQCSYEDLQNLRVLERACKDAGYDTEWRYVQEIHLGEDGRFYDGRTPGDNMPHLDVVFKLYPWEFMAKEEFGQPALVDTATFGQRAADGTYTGGTLWIEPTYKMLWSNKGILPVLWKLFGNDPAKSKLLIPAYFEGELPDNMTHYIRKPLLSREGASMQVVENGKIVLETPGDYGDEGYIYQEYCPPPSFLGSNEAGNNVEYHPVLGIWYIDGEPAGMCIRESEIVITDNLSYFVPHVIDN